MKQTTFDAIILSHRKREFIGAAVSSLRMFAPNVLDILVVDDSGDERHHQWLDDNGYQFSVVDPKGNAGYLAGMNMVWEQAQWMDRQVLLWEEDFIAKRPLDLMGMSAILNSEPSLAQLNLQRQSVYGIEKRLGYMESHHRRGYGLSRRGTPGNLWVQRRTPFTTNPSLINPAILGTEWPTREEADAASGGAEPAMSRKLEKAGFTFGWHGAWNTPYVHHVGDTMKSGTGY